MSAKIIDKETELEIVNLYNNRSTNKLTVTDIHTKYNIPKRRLYKIVKKYNEGIDPNLEKQQLEQDILAKVVNKEKLNLTYNDIAKQYEISISKLRRIIKQHNPELIKTFNKKPSNETVKEWYNLWQSGKTLTEIGKAYNYDPETVSRYLKNIYNIKIKNSISYSDDEIIKAYLENEDPLTNFLIEYNISKTQLHRILQRNNVKAKAPKKKLTADDIIKAQEMYDNDMSLNQIGKHFNVSGDTIKSNIKTIVNHPAINNPKLTDKEKENIIELYKTNNIAQTAKLVNHTETTVKKVLIDNNIEIRSRSIKTEEEKEILLSIEKYDSISAIAKEFNRDSETIRNLLKKHNKEVNGIFLSNNEKDQIAFSVYTYNSVNQIAKAFNRSNSTISKILKDKNIDYKRIFKERNVLISKIKTEVLTKDKDKKIIKKYQKPTKEEFKESMNIKDQEIKNQSIKEQKIKETNKEKQIIQINNILSNKEIEEIINHLLTKNQTGLTNKQISQKFNISYNTLKKIATEHSINIAQRPIKQLNIEEEQEIINLYKELKNMQKVKNNSKFSETDISKTLHKYNLIPLKNISLVSQEEKEFILKEFNSGFSMTQIGIKVNRNREKIKKILESQGLDFIFLAKEKEKTLNKIKLEIKKLYLSGKETGEIAKLYNLSNASIQNYLKEQNVVLRENRKYFFSENAFKELNKESLYWLGFLYADGHVVSTEKYHKLVINLQNKDENHLEKFCKWINIDHKEKIKYYTDYSCHVSFCSKLLTDDLVEKGIIPRKTYIHKPLDNDIISNPYFWQGMIDGDGSIYSLKNNYPSIRLYGNKIIINQYKNFLENTLNFNLAQNILYNKNNKLYSFALNGLQAQALLKLFIYSEHVGLERKKTTRDIGLLWIPSKHKYVKRDIYNK